MIAGDCVITDLCARLGYLENGKVKIMVVDTFHLFPETMAFLKDLEKHYKFKSEVFQAVGCADKAEYDKKVSTPTPGLEPLIQECHAGPSNVECMARLLLQMLVSQWSPDPSTVLV